MGQSLNFAGLQSRIYVNYEANVSMDVVDRTNSKGLLGRAKCLRGHFGQDQMFTNQKNLYSTLYHSECTAHIKNLLK